LGLATQNGQPIGRGAFRRYSGDTSGLGGGEILVWEPPPR